MSTKYSTTVSGDSISLNVTKEEHSLSLSRTGGQGSKGDSISNVEVNENDELLITISTSGGDVVETFNLGVVGSNTNIGALADVTITSVADGQILRYDSGSTDFVNHTLTTTSVSDIDNTGKADGAMLLFDGTSSKYKSTVNIDNENTFLKGGSY